jgi:hypothetical protein
MTKFGLEVDFGKWVKSAIGRLICVRKMEKIFPGFWIRMVKLGSERDGLKVRGGSVGSGAGVMRSLM